MFNKYYKPEEVKNMPYMYGLTLWGGFFNSDNVAVHNMLPALFEKTLFFENKGVRDNLLTSFGGSSIMLELLPYQLVYLHQKIILALIRLK